MLVEAGAVWTELRAILSVWDEIAAELDGVDPVHPDTRKKAEETLASLCHLAAELGASRRLKEPNEEMLNGVRSLVDKAFDYLGLAKALT